MATKDMKRDGISLRTIHVWRIIGAVVISGLMFYFTFHSAASFRSLTETSEEQIALRKAARELMDASDYLTEKVQCFTVLGDRQFMDAYFDEAFEAHRREEAIATMSGGTGAADALARLQAAMDGSVALMNREYYAMMLVILAQNITDYPQVLDTVELSAEDRALSPAEQMRLAAEMVHDAEYYTQKNAIRENMKASLDELEKLAYDAAGADDLFLKTGAAMYRAKESGKHAFVFHEE